MSAAAPPSIPVALEPLIGPHRFDIEVPIGPLGFRFQLWGREIHLGEGTACVEIDQLWMDTASLYPQRNRYAANFVPITDYFWARCHAAGPVTPAQQDIYLLAKLLPHARAHGSRRVLPDAILSRTVKRGRSAALPPSAADELEQILATAIRHPAFGLGSVEFRNRAADALGCPRFDEQPDVRAAYEHFVGDWLARARAALAAGDQAGLTSSLSEWRRVMANWGRHRGREHLKAVLDVLSYECRAAFHRCYTVVWQDLLYYLGTQGRLDVPSMRFIQLWHLDRSSPTGDPAVDFHLFHGPRVRPAPGLGAADADAHRPAAHWRVPERRHAGGGRGPVPAAVGRDRAGASRVHRSTGGLRRGSPQAAASDRLRGLRCHVQP